MRALSNFLAFLVFLFVVSFVIIWAIAQVDSPVSNDIDFPPLVKKDVPIPTKLHPKVEEAKNKLVTRSKQRGIDILITDDHRSIERQNELYAQGRTDEGSIVTYAEGGESYHNYGLAIDFALKLDNGDVVWDIKRDDNGNGKADWMEVVEIAKNLGFEWGGDWSSFKDYPHLQMDFGLSIRDLQYGERPEVDQAKGNEM